MRRPRAQLPEQHLDGRGESRVVSGSVYRIFRWLYDFHVVYTADVAKHLIDLDEGALGAARAELGTTTIKDTVNEALRRATLLREGQVAAALDVLADADLDDRSDAWR